jgi:uncharacterized protein involved in exopolysaccharide biosynthesis
LWRRRWILLGAFLLAATIGVVVAKFFVSRTYSTQAMLRFEGIPSIEGTSSTGIPEQPIQRLGAMVQSLFTDAPLREIATRMGMEEVPNHVLRNLFEVIYDPDLVVRVTASSETGEDAARFANTVVEVFLEHQLQAESRRLEAAANLMQERINIVTSALAEARERYGRFRERAGITDLTTEQEAAIGEAADLRASRDLAGSEIAALEARIEQLRRELRATPTTMAVVVTSASPEEIQLAESRAQLAAARGTLAPDHPRVLALEGQIDRLQAQVASSMGARTTTAGASPLHDSLQAAVSQAEADLQATRERHASLERLVAAAQGRLQQFSAIEGEASQLLGEVRRNEQLLAELEGRRARVLDAAQNPSHGFTVLSEAAVPEYADASKKKAIVAGAIPAATLLVLVLVLLGLELKGLAAKTPAEVAWWGNAPVVATSRWPRDAAGLDDLIADLDDFILKAEGTMLVVPIRVDDGELARTFCTRLGRDWMDTTMVGGSPFDEDAGLVGGYPSLPPSTSRGSELVLDTGARAHHVPLEAGVPFNVEAWEGADQGPALRRAARLADRVCILVPAGTSFLTLRQVSTRLGRVEGIGFVLLGAADEYLALEDRVGPVAAFWTAKAT